MINLIDQRGEINPDLKAFPKAQVTVSIFGTQASGKSTLMNHAFGTGFPVLDTRVSRGRCTKGVWYQSVPTKIIIDTEGFDSSDKTEDEKIFEKQISLFCVAISDVILVNMFMYEIGRYTGGHLDILETVFKVGERLVSAQKKRIVFVVRDCSPDADKSVLQAELEKEITQITNRYKNKLMKCTSEYYFMSDYHYQPEKFKAEAEKMRALMTAKVRSAIYNYKEDEDRLAYIQELWKKIRSFETEVDLKSIDEAIKMHVFQRLKGEISLKLQQELNHYVTLNDTKTYDRFLESLKRISLDYYTEHKPKHLKTDEIQSCNNKLFETFEPIAIKHFNETTLKNIEVELENTLSAEIEKNKNNKRLSSTIFKKKKEIIDHYKKIINNHKEYSLLLKHFNEKISEILSKEERKFSHLFNMFETTAEKQLNKEIDKQISGMVFKGEVISQRIKSLCQEYQYNEWEIDFKEIWERVSFRCIEKVIPQYIEEKSLKYGQDTWIFAGDQTTNIIAYHTRMEKKVIAFCREILVFLHEESTFSQPLSRIKDLVRQNLAKRLTEESRRFKISYLLISFLLLLLYGEMETILGFIVKKKKKRMVLRIYWYGALIMLAASLFQTYRQKKGKPVATDQFSQIQSE